MPASVLSAVKLLHSIFNQKPRHTTKMEPRPATVFSCLAAPFVGFAHVLQSWSRLPGVFDFRNAVRIAGLGAILAGSALPANGQVVVNYSPDQIGSVSAPVQGLGATSTDYLLTNTFGFDFLDKTFIGNGQEDPGYSNPSNAQDAASLDDNYMFQLSTTDGIRKVSLSDGSQSLINGNLAINTGANSFGIGYDANSNSIGIGLFDNGTMTFKEYDLGTNTLNTLSSFSFDTSAYGIPTGLDFKNNRMIVGTQDGPDSKDRLNLNYLLDMNANTGSIGQYATIAGSSDKLQDVLYDDGRLATAYDSGTFGLVQVGDFSIIPEPKSVALWLGAGVLGFVAFARRRCDGGLRV